MKKYIKGNSQASISLEMIVSLSIAVIILAGFISLLTAGLNVYKRTDSMDERFFSSDYLLSYLENEINKAEAIYVFDGDKFILYREVDEKNQPFLYYTYNLKVDEVIRLARRRDFKVDDSRVPFIDLGGHNVLCQGVDNFNYTIGPNYIDIHVEMESKILEKRIFLKCERINLGEEVDYEK